MLPAEDDRKVKRELTEQLKNAVGLDPRPTEELRDYCLHHPDQAVQVAAILVVERIGSKRAVLALTERVLKDEGLWPTERAMEALAELAPKGRLLALTATFLSDSRSIHRKLTLLFDGARKLHNYRAAESIEAIYRYTNTKYQIPELVPEILSMRESIPLSDIAKDIILAQLFRPLPVWASNVAVSDDTKVERALTYSKLRLPGLVEIMRERANSSV